MQTAGYKLLSRYRVNFHCRQLTVSRVIQTNAPINAKPEEEGAGVGRATHGNLTVTARSGIMHFIFQFQIVEER